MLTWTSDFVTEREWLEISAEISQVTEDSPPEVFLKTLSKLSRLRDKSRFLLFKTGSLFPVGAPRPFVAPEEKSKEILARMLLLFPNGSICPLIWKRINQSETEFDEGKLIPLPESFTDWKPSWTNDTRVIWEPHQVFKDGYRIQIRYPGPAYEEVIWKDSTPASFTQKREIISDAPSDGFEYSIPISGSTKHLALKKNNGNSERAIFLIEEKLRLSIKMKTEDNRPKAAAACEIDGNFILFIADHENNLHHLILDNASTIDSLENRPPLSSPIKPKKRHQMGIESLAFVRTADRNKLVLLVAFNNHQFRYYDPRSLKEINNRNVLCIHDTSSYMVSNGRHLLVFLSNGAMYAFKVRTREESKAVWNGLLTNYGFKAQNPWWEKFERILLKPYENDTSGERNSAIRFFVYYFCHFMLIENENENVRQSRKDDFANLIRWVSENTDKVVSQKLIRNVIETLMGFMMRKYMHKCLDFDQGERQPILNALELLTDQRVISEEVAEVLIQKGGLFIGAFEKLLEKKAPQELRQWKKIKNNTLLPIIFESQTSPRVATAVHKSRAFLKRSNLHSSISFPHPIQRLIRIDAGRCVVISGAYKLSLIEKSESGMWYETDAINTLKDERLNWQGFLTIANPLPETAEGVNDITLLVATQRRKAALIPLDNKGFGQPRDTDIFEGKITPHAFLAHENNVIIGGKDSNNQATMASLNFDGSRCMIQKPKCLNVRGAVTAFGVTQSSIYALVAESHKVMVCGRYHQAIMNLDFKEWLTTSEKPTALACSENTIFLGESDGLLRAIQEEDEYKSRHTSTKWFFRVPGAINSVLTTGQDDEFLVVGSSIHNLFIIEAANARLLTILGHVGPISSLESIKKKKALFMAASKRGEIWEVEYDHKASPDHLKANRQFETLSEDEVSQCLFCKNHQKNRKTDSNQGPEQLADLYKKPLKAILNYLASNRCGVLLIAGERGIGKSKLTRDALTLNGPIYRQKQKIKKRVIPVHLDLSKIGLPTPLKISTVYSESDQRGCKNIENKPADETGSIKEHPDEKTRNTKNNSDDETQNRNTRFSKNNFVLTDLDLLKSILQEIAYQLKPNFNTNRSGKGLQTKLGFFDYFFNKCTLTANLLSIPFFKLICVTYIKSFCYLSFFCLMLLLAGFLFISFCSYELFEIAYVFSTGFKFFPFLLSFLCFLLLFPLFLRLNKLRVFNKACNEMLDLTFSVDYQLEKKFIDDHGFETVLKGKNFFLGGFKKKRNFIETILFRPTVPYLIQKFDRIIFLLQNLDLEPVLVLDGVDKLGINREFSLMITPGEFKRWGGMNLEPYPVDMVLFWDRFQRLKKSVFKNLPTLIISDLYLYDLLIKSQEKRFVFHMIIDEIILIPPTSRQFVKNHFYNIICEEKGYEVAADNDLCKLTKQDESNGGYSVSDLIWLNSRGSLVETFQQIRQYKMDIYNFEEKDVRWASRATRCLDELQGISKKHPPQYLQDWLDMLCFLLNYNIYEIVDDKNISNNRKTRFRNLISLMNSLEEEKLIDSVFIREKAFNLYKLSRTIL